MVLRIGSGAAELYETRQVREEAAVSSSFRVPPGCLIGANWFQVSHKTGSRAGARPHLTVIMGRRYQQTGSLLVETKALLRRYHLQARKGLGQHFLIDDEVLKLIIAAAELSPNDVVLEVGPGLGILTREMARQVGRVVAVELDNRLASILEQALAPLGNVTIINEDVLKVEPAALLRESAAGFSPTVDSPPSYKVVANLPYYITSAVLRHFLESSARPQVMGVMVQ